MRGHTPDLSDDEATDLYLLWRHGRMDPEDAMSRPGWVVDLLAGGLRSELGGERGEPQGDPYENVPDALKGL